MDSNKLTSKFIKNKHWNRYKRIITKFLSLDAGRQPITWARYVNVFLPMGEDSGTKYQLIDIDGLIYYNAFRNWPINQATVSGELDEENLSIYISKASIESLGYLTKEGYWNFDWANDRFIVNGVVYRPTGDTEVAQAKDEALAFLLILKRDRDSQISSFKLNTD